MGDFTRDAFEAAQRALNVHLQLFTLLRFLVLCRQMLQIVHSLRSLEWTEITLKIKHTKLFPHVISTFFTQTRILLFKQGLVGRVRISVGAIKGYLRVWIGLRKN